MALLGRELVEELSDGIVQGFDCSRRGLAQEMLELGEDLLNRIEVGAVGRQIDELGTLGLDGCPESLSEKFVIDISWLQVA